MCLCELTQTRPVSFPESTFERATGEVHRGPAEGASDPSHQEGGVGAGAVVGGVHYHRRCADLPRLSLRVSRRLVGTSAPQVSTSSEEERRAQGCEGNLEHLRCFVAPHLLMNSFSLPSPTQNQRGAVSCGVSCHRCDRLEHLPIFRERW